LDAGEVTKRSAASNDTLPNDRGTYALVLHAEAARRLRVGRLGWLEVSPGFYLYVGSALGSGGLAARVTRHRRLAAVRHWHIDYLRARTRLESVWYACDDVRREHEWACVLRGIAGSRVACPGFGASDCRCDTHLFHFRSAPSLAAFREAVLSGCVNHPAIFRWPGTAPAGHRPSMRPISPMY
jgi:Uri superfamily endonuclease